MGLIWSSYWEWTWNITKKWTVFTFQLLILLQVLKQQFLMMHLEKITEIKMIATVIMVLSFPSYFLIHLQIDRELQHFLSCFEIYKLTLKLFRTDQENHVESFFLSIAGTAWLKGTISGLTQFLVTGSFLKIIKNAFYFTSRALFLYKISKFLFWTFR